MYYLTMLGVVGQQCRVRSARDHVYTNSKLQIQVENFSK